MVPEPEFHEIEELFHQAVRFEGSERARFLDGACSERPELREAVERLIHRDATLDDSTPAGRPTIARARSASGRSLRGVGTARSARPRWHGRSLAGATCRWRVRAQGRTEVDANVAAAHVRAGIRTRTRDPGPTGTSRNRPSARRRIRTARPTLPRRRIRRGPGRSTKRAMRRARPSRIASRCSVRFARPWTTPTETSSSTEISSPTTSW